MATELLALGIAAANSADITVAAGTNPFNRYFQSGIIVGGTLTDADRNAIEAILMARIGA